jgi:hypothetical protein
MKTAAELGIEPIEHLALRVVRDGLASGAFRHVKNAKWFSTKGDGQPVFSMDTVHMNTPCGTVGCIGGWMAAEMQMSRAEAVEYVSTQDEDDTVLKSLFYPAGFRTVGGTWDNITPKRAAKAIDNFLNTGDPQWAKVLPKGSYDPNAD